MSLRVNQVNVGGRWVCVCVKFLPLDWFDLLKLLFLGMYDRATWYERGEQRIRLRTPFPLGVSVKLLCDRWWRTTGINCWGYTLMRQLGRAVFSMRSMAWLLWWLVVWELRGKVVYKIDFKVNQDDLTCEALDWWRRAVTWCLCIRKTKKWRLVSMKETSNKSLLLGISREFGSVGR